MSGRSDITSATTDRILAAARGIVETDGAASLTIRRVASAASVSPSLVIRYFGSRGQLLIDVFEARRAGYADRLARAATDGGPVRARIDALVAILFERDLEDPGFTRDFRAAAWSASVEDMRRTLRETMRDVKFFAQAFFDAPLEEARRRAAARALTAVYLLCLNETLTAGEGHADGHARFRSHVDLLFEGFGDFD